MGGRPGSSLYAMPVIRNLTACSSVHPGNPAMFGVLSAQTGIGAIGLNVSVAPFSTFPGRGSPFSLMGVWQSPHIATASTRYFPRAIFADCVGLAEDDSTALSITTKNSAATPTYAASFMT